MNLLPVWKELRKNHPWMPETPQGIKAEITGAPPRPESITQYITLRIRENGGLVGVVGIEAAGSMTFVDDVNSYTGPEGEPS